MSLLSSLMRRMRSHSEISGVDRLDPSHDVHHLKKVFDRCSKAARIGVWECSLPDERLSWTDMVYELFDLQPGEPLVRDDIVALYSPEASKELTRLRNAAIEQRGSFSLDAEIVTCKGNRRWIRITATVECENDIPVRIFGLKQDVTAEVMMLHEIRRRADFDHLTGLPNRFSFHERLDALCGSGLETNTALLLIDLDGFKRVNDTLGHRMGDTCLVEAARRLAGAAEHADLVARIGGDEFAVIYTGTSVGHVEHAASRIVQEMQWDARDGIVLGASVGIAWAVPGTTSATLYEEADKAMYRAKTQGRARLVAHCTTTDEPRPFRSAG
ncbi:MULTISPECIES: sensor domain-containing diguanylate cyclase [unclassified Rhizobium]|uniref:GGDEF domain-containing protein n=1 Tax=unclassified Rhizobium TaxID=2613769 RepID=UPI001FEDA347|nr:MULTISPECIES: GGDEF domain-containing protein [unclassified Rhizobium]